MKNNYLFTSESVLQGHPDKVCDQISDAILDECLKQDPLSRVALETIVSKQLVVLTGEITSSAEVDFEKIAKEVLREIGYTDQSIGLDCDTCQYIVNVSTQSPDIALGVDIGGAGDQGIMFGYASSETEELMPLPIMLAHKICYTIDSLRKNKTLEYLRPDGKAQITILYEDDKPKYVDTIIISVQHNPEVSQSKIHSDIKSLVIDQVIPKEFTNEDTKIYINPTGLFEEGGPQGDVGLTGRKIIVDTYGGFAKHGGGAFSGKDPTKVDRSAAYMCRYMAKNIVARGYSEKVEIQIGYAIGVKQPVSIFIDTFGTEKVPKRQIFEEYISKLDLSPYGIIKKLDLLKPKYKETAKYGHFGYQERSWEKISH